MTIVEPNVTGDSTVQYHNEDRNTVKPPFINELLRDWENVFL